MKTFKKNGKINIVDENNVFVGYDITQECCEYADYYFSQSAQYTFNEALAAEGDNQGFEFKHEDYRFDTKFFVSNVRYGECICEEDHKIYHAIGKECPCLEGKDPDSETQWAAFRLQSIHSNEVVYLIIHNDHNGYYSHGFEVDGFKVAGAAQEGYL